ncbi:MAG: histidinol dehydrogenase, partial [Gammaproteobacteria bacterium]|nr:histidinol dehydrogenase [Gammaproteobacteria bacterium]
GIESLAGPSEITILTDESGDAGYIASDLLSQAEHDPQARSILVSTDEALVKETRSELEKQLETLPRREIA